MIRVVPDSNVYISALVFGGAPSRIFELATGGRIRIFVSQPIMDEVAGVLRKKFDWSGPEIARFLPPLWSQCSILRTNSQLTISPDPADNRILECAEAARADFLVTGNTKHFPKQHFVTRVVTIRQLLDLLEVR